LLRTQDGHRVVLVSGIVLANCTVRGADGLKWDGIEYYDPAGGKGAVYLFKPAATPASQNFRLKGLDRAASYCTSFEDSTRTTAVKTGVELMDQGLTVTLPGAEMSELIFFEVLR
jgi:hypothetical protein